MPTPARWIEYRPVGELVPAVLNPKRHDLDTLRASVARHGYVEPIVMDERTGRLVAGHGRTELLAALEVEGGAPPNGVEVDEHGAWMVPVVRGWSSDSDDQASAYVVASNRLVELGGWDETDLSELLAGLSPTDLEATGYKPTDLADLLAKLAPPPGLDDLAGKHGAPDDTAMWPVLRFKVAPADRDRYLRLVEGVEGGDDRLFAHLLDLAER